MMCLKQVFSHFSCPQNSLFYSGRLACSYFDPTEGVLYTMEDTDENRHYDLTARSEFGLNLMVSSDST